MYSYELFKDSNKSYNKKCWILDPNGVVICYVDNEGHAVVLVDHLNRKA